MTDMVKVTDVIFNSRDEAEDILSKMKDHADMYGMITTEDFYDLVGIIALPGDYEYGWTLGMLRDAEIVRARRGWAINIPKPVPTGITRKSKPTSSAGPKPKPLFTSKPLTININTSEVDSPDEVFADVFKYVYTITDREVIINIT